MINFATASYVELEKEGYTVTVAPSQALKKKKRTRKTKKNNN